VLLCRFWTEGARTCVPPRPAERRWVDSAGVHLPLRVKTRRLAISAELLHLGTGSQPAGDTHAGLLEFGTLEMGFGIVLCGETRFRVPRPDAACSLGLIQRIVDTTPLRSRPSPPMPVMRWAVGTLLSIPAVFPGRDRDSSFGQMTIGSQTAMQGS